MAATNVAAGPRLPGSECMGWFSRSVVGALAAVCFGGGGVAQTPSSPVTYQSGGSGGTTSTLCRSMSLPINFDPTTAPSNVGPELVCNWIGSVGLLDFPQIFGTGAGQIPPGATITSATLDLWCTAMASASASTRPVTVTPIIDFARGGTWHEPASTGVLTGASYMRRDARPEAGRYWVAGNANGNITNSIANDPVFLAALPGLQATLQTGGATSWQASTWHTFNVTTSVVLWSQGLSNQGWLVQTGQAQNLGNLEVRYASDDHADPTRRPKLTITFSVPAQPAPWNHVPRLLAPVPAVATTRAGEDLALYLSAVDDDLTPPSYLVTKSPSNGVLLGTFPLVTYRPNPGFVGTDTFSYAALDQIAVSFPATISVSVTATAGLTALDYQAGTAPAVAPSAGATAATYTVVDAYEVGNQLSYESPMLSLFGGARQAFLAFPNLVGNGPGQLPPGSTIVDARLELRTWVVGAPSVAGTERSLFLERLVDPLGRGSGFQEPTTLTSAVPTPEVGLPGVGATFLYARHAGGTPLPWAFATGTSPTLRYAIGGDVHPTDRTSLRVLASEAGTTFTRGVDVTASVRAWVRGEPNHGWLLRQSDPSTLFLHSDDAATPSDRPRLRVAFLPPGTPAPANSAPHADAGGDRRVVSGETVRLDGRRSHHPNGLPMTPVWWQTRGPAVTLSNPYSFTPTFVAPTVAAGSRTVLGFLFAVHDGAKLSTDEIAIDVLATPSGTPIASPVANAGADRTVPEGSLVTLGGSATGGTAAPNLQFLWSQIEGPIVALSSRTSLAPSFVAPTLASGTTRLVFDLAVVDAGVPSGVFSVAHAEVTITVENLATNTPPVANAGSNRTVEAGTWVELDASASTDPEGHPVTFGWTQLSPATPAIPLTNYVAAGTAAAARVPFRTPEVTTTTPFVFRVAVSDGELTSLASVTVTVTPKLPGFIGQESLSPYRDALTGEEARHLLRRLGAGWHPDDVAAVRAAGLAATIDDALARTPGPAIDVEIRQHSWPIANPTNPVPEQRQPFDPWPQLDGNQVEAAWLLYLFRSTAPLTERMTHFLNDRLAASSRNVIVSKRHWCLGRATMLRQGSVSPALQAQLGLSLGCFGNWRDLLYDFAIDAVTLSFIEGFNNQNVAPNENFGREFFELHALGVRDLATNVPLYTQFDVEEAARAWTGYRPVAFGVGAPNSESWYPAFVPFLHDFGPKLILGQSGNFGPETMADVALAYQGGVPASRHLAKGLLRHFVRFDPSLALVDALAAKIRQEDFALRPVLSALLRSQAMFSPGARKSIAKTPAEFANGLVRTLKVPLQTMDLVGSSGLSLKYHLGTALHALSNPIDVNGFPKDVEWLDGYGAVRRSELCRQIMLYCRAPTTAANFVYTPPGGSPVNYPNYPYTVTGSWPYLDRTPVSLDAFLPPPKARRSGETLDLLAELLDVELRTTPGSAGTNERTLCLQYLDTLASGAAPPYTYTNRPFDGDDPSPSHQDKLWGLLLLLTEVPDFVRL